MAKPALREYGSQDIHLAPGLEPFLHELVRQGPHHFIDNVAAEMRILAVDGYCFPLLLASPADRQSDVCSPFAHYVSYTREEVTKRNAQLPPSLLKLLFRGWGQLARKQWLDRVVYFNNWLFSTNPPMRLGQAQLEAVTGYLRQRYPDRAIIIRSLNQVQDQETISVLSKLAFQPIAARTVHLLEPVGEQRRSWKRNLRIDAALLEKSGLELGGAGQDIPADAVRMAELYRSLYIDKHSALNQQFNAHFFELMMNCGMFEALVLRQDQRIVGMVFEHLHGARMLAQAIGYDRSLPASMGIYRQVIAALIVSASRQQATLNLSGGISEFKRHRGAVPCVEWDLVFHRHLPLYRRLAWALVQWQGRLWAGKPALAAGVPAELSGPADWERSGRDAAGATAQQLWRRCSDAVYLDLLAEVLEPVQGRLLKTDLWDEAGGGGLLAELAGYTSRVIGLDIAASTVRRARREHPDGALLQADVLALPLQSGSIKAVVSNSTLDHFEHQDQLLQGLAELARVLAPGGQLFITLDNPSNPVVWLRNHLPIRWLLRSRVVPYYVGATLSARQLRAALEQLGFEVQHSGYSVHTPRVLMVAMSTLLQRWAPESWQQAFIRLQQRFEGLARWPTARWSGHYVFMLARRKER